MQPLTHVLLHCRHVKEYKSSSYPVLVLQRKPKLEKIPGHKLMAWLTQGPPPAPSASSSSRRRMQVVSHYDIATSKHSNLTWEQDAKGAVVESKPVVCLSHKCVSPHCLFYSSQSYNARTGKSHRVQLDKHSKQFTGGKCDVENCPVCQRALRK